MTRPLAITAAVLASLALAACGAGRGAAAPTPTPASLEQAERAAAVERARADSARRPYTEADVRFMTEMIGHHAQAIAMSRLAPTHEASAEVRTLAARIINAQRDEIATMQQWLRDRGKPVPEPDTTGSGGGAGHDMHAMHHGALMPGMLTPGQVRELDAARGRDFDRLFLAFMIQHHRGAVSMVQQLFAARGAGQDDTVFKFASDVNVDQTTEIARMRRMLLALESTQ